MGAIREAVAVKWICGILAADAALLADARESLTGLLGAIDNASDIWPFEFTDYYEPEMGRSLLRQFVTFAAAGDPGELARIKRATNELERRYAVPEGGGLRRKVNLDPGYLTPAKLVLATTKDFSHRIHLSQGIYAEVTLNFGREGVIPNPWTYPDYRSGLYAPFLLGVRKALIEAGSGRL